MRGRTKTKTSAHAARRRRHHQVFWKPPETESLWNTQLFTIEPGVRDGQMYYLQNPIGWLYRKDDRECVKGIGDLQDRIIRSDNGSWRFGGIYFSVMPAPMHMVIGCFHTMTTDIPFQPVQLVTMDVLFPEPGLSASDLFNFEEMLSSTPETPVQSWNSVFPYFSLLTFSLLQL